MKAAVIGFIIMISLALGISGAHGQSFTQLSHSVDSLIHVESSLFSRGEYLLKHSESFRRLLWLRALTTLGVTVDRFAALHAAERPMKLAADTILEERNDLSNDIFNQDEPSVAICRTNPKLIVVGANDEAMFTRSMPAYVTTDAGKNWQTYRMPSFTLAPYQPGGDPMLTADAGGRIYYAFLIYDQSALVSNLQVASSIDGQKWTYLKPVLPTGVERGFEDKEAIAVDRDPESPHFGRLYIAWEHFASKTLDDTTGLKLSWSDDHGQSWSTPKWLTQSDGLFVQPLVGRAGLLALTYSGIDSMGHSGSHYLAISTDGGNTFVHERFFDYTDYPHILGNNETLKGPSSFRAFPYIASAMDEKTNRLYVVFGNYDTVAQVANLYYSTILDLGQKWSAPLSVGALTSSGDRFHPTVALDQTSGQAFVSYYTSAEDPNNVLSKIVRTPLNISGLGKPLSLEPISFNPLLCEVDQNFFTPFIGDYTGSDAFAGVYASAWTEGQPTAGDGEVYGYVASPQAGVESGFVLGATVSMSHPSVDPVADQPVTIRFTTKQASAAQLELIDITGKTLERRSWDRLSAGEHSSQFSLASLPAGVYFFRLTSSGEVHSEQIAHLK